jgi:hypothetical protein
MKPEMKPTPPKYPFKGKYTPKPVTPKVIKSVDATNENKIPKRPIN